jgi:hypothetical protein
MKARRLCAVIVLAAALTSCGGGDDDDQAETISEPDPTTTSTAEGSSSTTEAAAGQPEPDDDPEVGVDDDTPPTAEALDAMVLQLGDMPAGFTASPPDEAGTDDDFEDSCDAYTGDFPEPAVETERSYQADEFGPFVISNVSWYDDADAMLDAFVDLAEQCREWTDTDEEGNETRGSFSPMSFPSLGDRTFALAINAESGGFPFAARAVYVVVGDHLVTGVFDASFGGESGVDLERLARLAVDRVG